MNIGDRRKDLTQIVDDRWNAKRNAHNHVREVKEHDRMMNQRLAGGNSSLGIRRNNVNYRKEGLDRLNGNINAIRNNNRGKF